jgi:hypothetical protein
LGFPDVEAGGVGADGAVDGAGTGATGVACVKTRWNMASIDLTNLSDASSDVGIAGTRDPGGPRSASGRCPVARKYSNIRAGSTSSNFKSLNMHSGDLRGEGGPCRRVRTRETDRRPDILTERRKLTKQTKRHRSNLGRRYQM